VTHRGARRSAGGTRRYSVPEILVLAAVALVPAIFYRGTSDAYEFPKMEFLATDAIIIASYAIVLYLRDVRRTGLWISIRAVPAALARDPLGLAIILFLGSAVLSTIMSVRPEMSVLGAPNSLAGLVTAFSTATLYFTSLRIAIDARWLERITRAAAFAAAVAIGYALFQLADLDPFVWTKGASIGEFTRVAATLGHPNHLGGYIAMVTPLFVWMGLRAARQRARVLWLSLVVLAVPVLAATLSRGAWVAAVAGLGVYGGLEWVVARKAGRSTIPSTTRTRGRRSLTVAATGVVAGAVLLALLAGPLGSPLSTRLRQIGDLNAPSTHQRFYLWGGAIRMAAEHPLFGVGTDAFLAEFPMYRKAEQLRAEWNSFSSKAHNELIQVAATQGAVGAITLILVVIFGIRAVLVAARHPNPSVRQGAAAVGGALTAFVVQDLASFTVVATGSLAAVLAGWAAGAIRGAPPVVGGVAQERTGAGKQRPGRAEILAGAFLGLALWVPLVALPWAAEAAASPGLRHSIDSSAREEGLTKAVRIAPWDARYASDLGRAMLAQAYATTDQPRRWDLLVRASAAFERAVRIGPENAENHALLGSVLAAQAALRPGEIPTDEIRAAFVRARELDPEGANVLELATQGYLKAGLLADARASSLRCATLFPDYALPMSDLGLLALMEGRFADAADTLALALQRDWHGQVRNEEFARQNLEAARARMKRP